MRLDVDAEGLVAGIAILAVVAGCTVIYLGIGDIIASLLRLDGLAYWATLIAWPFIVAIACVMVQALRVALFGSRGES